MMETDSTRELLPHYHHNNFYSQLLFQRCIFDIKTEMICIWESYKVYIPAIVSPIVFRLLICNGRELNHFVHVCISSFIFYISSYIYYISSYIHLYRHISSHISYTSANLLRIGIYLLHIGMFTAIITLIARHIKLYYF